MDKEEVTEVGEAVDTIVGEWGLLNHIGVVIVLRMDGVIVLATR